MCVIDGMNKQDLCGGEGNCRAIYFVSPKHCIQIFRLSNTIFIQKVQPIKYQHSSFDLKSNILPPPVNLLIGREEGVETIRGGEQKLGSVPASLGLEYSNGRRRGAWGAEKFSRD